MSAFGPDIVDEITTVLQSNFISNCCSAASCVLVLYDHLTTQSREMDFIWGRRWTSVTLLFHLNRWTIFVWAVLQVIFFLPFSTPASCVGINDFDNAVTLVLIVLWAAFSTIRMYAISGGCWWRSSAVWFLNMVPFGINAYYAFATFWHQIDNLPVIGLSCDSGSKLPDTVVTKLTIASRVCAITADVLVLVVTWSRTYEIKRIGRRSNVRMPLASMLLKDGTLYFITLLAINILNIVGESTNVFIYASSAFSAPLSSIIISHFLMNLRQIDQSDRDNLFDTTHPSFVTSHYTAPRFASFVDNMGEHLDADLES